MSLAHVAKRPTDSAQAGPGCQRASNMSSLCPWLVAYAASLYSQVLSNSTQPLRHAAPFGSALIITLRGQPDFMCVDTYLESLFNDNTCIYILHYMCMHFSATINRHRSSRRWHNIAAYSTEPNRSVLLWTTYIYIYIYIHSRHLRKLGLPCTSGLFMILWTCWGS